MMTGNRLLDATLELNEHIKELNSKIDKLQVATDKIAVNTTIKATP